MAMCLKNYVNCFGLLLEMICFKCPGEPGAEPCNSLGDPGPVVLSQSPVTYRVVMRMKLGDARGDLCFTELTDHTGRKADENVGNE